MCCWLASRDGACSDSPRASALRKIRHLLFQDVVGLYAVQRAIKIPGAPDFDPSCVVDSQRKMGFGGSIIDPAIPSDKLVTSVRQTGEKKGDFDEGRFVARVEDRICLTNGRALIKVVEDERGRVGQRISYDGALCTVRFIGEVAGTTGTWLGVEWDDSARGKHNGSHKGVRYFTCKSKSSTAASFVRPSRPCDPPRHFLDAVKHKYASEYMLPDGRRAAEEIIFFGKRAEEVGFEKIRRKQANVGELTVVILEDLQVTSARAEDEQEGIIAKTCPKITQIDLSRNLFERLDPVLDVCRELPNLQHLSIKRVAPLGNRFQHVLENQTTGDLGNVKELSLEETMMSWEEVCHIATKCPSLAALDAGSNQLPSLPAVDYGRLASTLTSINLEINEFTTLADISTLTTLSTLRNIHLKGNNISAIAPDGSQGPVFSSSVQYLDVSYNKIQSWAFVDQLLRHFPGLTALRIGHNPFYDAVDVDAKASSAEESHMFTVARLASLKSLNFSKVTPADRNNAEMFYLSRIAKQLGSVSEDVEAEVLALHPRYAELCEIYGAPSVVRRLEVNPAFLEARLITVGFHAEQGEENVTKIPKSYDIYAVKGVAGKLFGLSPLKLRLIWETGEWDPVAGFDDQDDGSSDEEDAEEERERQGLDTHAAQDTTGKPGRWVKREVELKDGPRQLGYCVGGLDVKIRVEAR
ncbi:hypothetical protein FZEAL_1110 [Fusarium zealandicum]|uniref:CAP-Gly domain-containing protein n=1 Tax=Fusarium zealandicum TaxID=1053134 RepID=A0A8H4XP49_9HYPO|nr:hypothetical protein FZEAL_1110 [Fusarium zealandicum]